MSAKIVVSVFGHMLSSTCNNFTLIITTTKEHAINLSILINVDIGLCGRLESVMNAIIENGLALEALLTLYFLFSGDLNCLPTVFVCKGPN